MTGANYIKHMKVIGKLVKLYDDSASSSSSQNTLRAAALDQVATGLSADLPASDIFAGVQVTWSGAISSGSAALQALALSIATNYFVSSYFRADLTTAPATVTLTGVIAAWITDASSGIDNKTFSTRTTFGFLNFMDQLNGSTAGFQQSGSPSYPDGTYVTATVL